MSVNNRGPNFRGGFSEGNVIDIWHPATQHCLIASLGNCLLFHVGGNYLLPSFAA